MQFISYISVKVNRKAHGGPAALGLFVFLILCAAATGARAQTATEPIVPFERLLSRPVKLRPELAGKHPRVFFTTESLAKLRQRAQTPPHSELWRKGLAGERLLKLKPLPPGAPELDRSGHGAPQYRASYALAELTLAYAIEQDPRLLEAAKQWLLAIIQYEPWGYTFSKPNTDLPAAHFLYAVGLAYDTLYDKLTEEERSAVRRKLVRQGNLMYEYFRYKPKKTYAYSQNHTGIPQAGLAVAAFALMGEEKDAEQWAQLSRAIYDRILSTFGIDGYYYEGFHYYVFSLHWIVRYLDALEHATGEDLYPRMRERFAPLKFYAAHSVLPGGDGVFDFGDTGKGSVDRNGETVKLNTGHEVLYRFAAKYRDEQAQGVAHWLRRDLQTETWEDFWAFYSYDAGLRAAPITSLPTFHHFEDNDTVFWRSSWSANATAVAFRCGPPEGHHVTALKPRIPEWRLSTGHAHPDSNSFIIYANGRYLTGDTGYIGVKLAGDHNTVLVDDRGHADEGQHHIYKDVPYERLDRIEISDRVLAPDHFYVRGEAATAYFPELGLERFTRHFLFAAPDYFLVWDELQTKEPRRFTWLLNADRKIEQLAPSRFLIINEPAALFVERVAPANADVKIEPQMVIGQGKPGSVEKGEPDLRGLQLIARTTEKIRQAEFVHFLQPALANDSARPSVKALSGSDGRTTGVRIEWASGETEWVVLRESAEGITTDAKRAVLRMKADGAWRRIIIHSGKRLVHEATTILRAEQPVTVSLETNGEAWRGFVSTAAPTEVTVNVRRRPRVLRINGESITTTYDETAGTISFSVRAGGSRIEAD